MRSAHPEAQRVSGPADRTFQPVLSPGLVEEPLSPSTAPDESVSRSPELRNTSYSGCPALPGSESYLDHAGARVDRTLDPGRDPLSDMSLAVGGSLIPGQPYSPTHREMQKTAAGLRLPSFELLGIAAPHPDRIGHSGYFEGIDVAGTARAPSNLGYSHPSLRGARRALQAPLCYEVDVLTPPADQNDIAWNQNTFATMPLPMDSPNSNSEQAPVFAENADQGVKKRNVAPADVPVLANLSPSRLNHETQTATPDLTFHDGGWLRPAIDKLLSHLHDASGATRDTLRVLSHALPNPSEKGHIFRSIIDQIHNDPAAQEIVWLNVLHAIQGEFNLRQLPPSSPLSTPGPAIGGDYFTTKKVFDTAVTILDYQSELSVQNLSPNRAVSSPGSIDIAIVERYIPPTNDNEFSEMFNMDGASILVDRLIELSTNNGTLIFVYPNKTGARTFYQNYLDPIKAPTLRAFASQYSVPISIGEDLDKEDKVTLDKMPEHWQLSNGMHTLCTELTQRSSTMPKLRNRHASFTIVHESTAQVAIEPDAWLTDWWSKQEKRKLRRTMQVLAHRALSQKSDPHLPQLPGANQLAQQLVRNMEHKAKTIDRSETGIEVSIFVIKRTA